MTHVHTITGKDGFRTSTYMYSTQWNILPTLVCLGKEIKDPTLCFSNVWFTTLDTHLRIRHAFFVLFKKTLNRNMPQNLHTLILVHFCQHCHMTYVPQNSIRLARKSGGYSGRYRHSPKSPHSVIGDSAVRLRSNARLQPHDLPTACTLPTSQR